MAESDAAARASFMTKDSEDTLNPMAYRVLLMLPVLYRTWATARLQHLAPWISTWAMDEMFARMEGKGAADAAYHTAIITEHALVNCTAMTGGGLRTF